VTPTETAVRALAAAIYSAREVWLHTSPRRGRRAEAHYVLRGPTRYAHVTVGRGTTADAAWADALRDLRADAEGRLARARAERDRAEAEIARLTAALEVQP
jgi:membrane protein required for beta-lactamase induction